MRSGGFVQVDWQQGKFDPNGSKIQPTHSMLVTGPIHNADGSLKDILLV